MSDQEDTINGLRAEVAALRAELARHNQVEAQHEQDDDAHDQRAATPAPQAQAPYQAAPIHAPEARALKVFDGSTNVDRWISTVEVYAHAVSWTEEQATRAIPTYLAGGPLSAFLRIPEDRRSKDAIFAALRAQYGESLPLKRQRFYERVQGRDESVLAFTTAMQELASTVKASEVELKTIWTKGLAPRIRHYVVAIDDEETPLSRLIQVAMRVEISANHGAAGAKSHATFSPPSTRHDGPFPDRQDRSPDSHLREVKKERRQDSVICYNCHRPGHISRDCLQDRAQDRSQDRAQDRPQERSHDRYQAPYQDRRETTPRNAPFATRSNGDRGVNMIRTRKQDF